MNICVKFNFLRMITFRRKHLGVISVFRLTSGNSTRDTLGEKSVELLLSGMWECALKKVSNHDTQKN